MVVNVIGIVPARDDPVIDFDGFPADLRALGKPHLAPYVSATPTSASGRAHPTRPLGLCGGSPSMQ